MISQAVTIDGQGWSYIAPADNGNAITVNAVSGNVTIRGVSLNGVGTTGSTNGIQFNSGGNLSVRDSLIQNLSNDGILFQPDSSTLSKISVFNTFVSDNGGNGIEIASEGPETTNGSLNHVEMENNSGQGLYVHSLVQTINIIVSDSTTENNTGDGVLASSSNPGGPVTIMVRNSISANNGSYGLQTNGLYSTILVTRSTIIRNQTGWGGEVVSYGDNNIDYNGANNSTPPNPLVYH
jgi:hypothetical protein